MILKELLRRPIAFHRVFVDITDSVNAALFLSQACYWSEVTDWDWFYKTQQEWQKETGLTRHEQDAVRRKLVQLEVMEEVRQGVPARMFYRVKAENIADLIATFRQSSLSINQQSSLPNSGNLYKEAETTTEITAENTLTLSPPSPTNGNHKSNDVTRNGITATRYGFMRPSIGEVRAYCKERGNNVNPDKWMAHYLSNGFKVGRSPMKDWKAAVITWESSDFGKPNSIPAQPGYESQSVIRRRELEERKARGL